MPARATAAGGFAIGALAFGAVGLVDAYATMAVLHVVAGLAAATALSVTHATIDGSSNPHRRFAIVGFALGVFGILFMGSVPKIVAAVGAPALFWSFAGIMAFAACVAAFGFPESRAAGTVLVCGPIVQALLALLITQSQSFIPYAAGAMFVAAVMIFTRTFMKSG